jgi:hypothetical protein
MTYPFGEVKIKDTDLTPEAFIYKFTHKPSGKWYLGMHGLKEGESHLDGAYWNSSTDDEFKELLEEKPKEFLYEISEYGSMEMIYKKENKILESLDAAKNKMSYNKWNGIKYESEELPRLDVIDKLAKDAYDKKSDLERKLEKVKQIFDDPDLIRLQVRFETSKSSKKVSEYKNEMKSNNNTKGFTLTIVRLPGGKKVLVGGNHTGQAVISAKLLNIEVVYIDMDLTMEEMLALGDALNRRTEIDRMVTAMEDTADKLVGMYNSKKITDKTFKTKYCTDFIKTTGGFKGHEISRVRKMAVDSIEDDSQHPKGKTWINWTSKKKRLNGKISRVEEKINKVNAEMDDNTFCTFMTCDMFRTDGIMEQWVTDKETREELGKEPRHIIKIYRHHSAYKKYIEYGTSQVEDKHERILLSFLKGEGIKNPKIIWKNLEYYEDKVS